jgi:multidrug efflux pump subunit AcrA (membrane-fusion protein)
MTSQTYSDATRPARDLSSLHLVESPNALRVLAWILAATFGCALIGLFVVPWQQTVLGTGRVVAYAPFDRIQTLAAPVSGRVRQAWVVEGTRVDEGERILEIVDNDPSILQRLDLQRVALESQLTSTRERVVLFDRQIDALEAGRQLAIESAASQVDVASASVRSATAALTGARATAEQARLNYRRQKELVEEGLVSSLDFEIADRVNREAQAALAQAEQALEAARSEEIARRADLGRIETQATAEIESARGSRESAAVDAAALAERLANLDSRIAQQNTQLITAPRAGTVFRIFAAPGAELVQAGDPLVSLIPETESRAVEIWVNGNDVPLISPGRPVRLQFEGWPAVQFSGWPAVAVGTFGGRVALVDPTDDGTGRFRILVVPDPDDEPWPEGLYLRQGVRANAFVLLDEVSLGYELWRRANGFPPTVAMDAPAPPAKRGSQS